MKYNKAVYGTVLCIGSLILLGKNIIILGVPLFVAGILMMNNWKWPWSRR